MKKFLCTAILLGVTLTGCQKTEETVESFKFGEDLVFVGGESTIDLENSSDLVKEKYEIISEIFSSTEVTKDVAALTTTTANIFEATGYTPTAAPESASLSETLKTLQYTVDQGGIDKSKILNIGSAISPNVEALVELQPEVAIYSDAMGYPEFIQNIEKAGVNVKALPQSDYIDMFVLVDVLKNLNETDEIVELADNMYNTLVIAEKQIEEYDGETKTVAVLQVTSDVIYANNNDSVLGRLVTALEMENVFGTNASGEVSKEQLISLNPDFIIYYAHGMGGEAIVAFEEELNNPEGIYRSLEAVKNNNAFPVESDEFKFSASVDFDIIKVVEFLGAKFYE